MNQAPNSRHLIEGGFPRNLRMLRCPRQNSTTMFSILSQRRERKVEVNNQFNPQGWFAKAWTNWVDPSKNETNRPPMHEGKTPSLTTMTVWIREHRVRPYGPLTLSNLCLTRATNAN